jgi:hypothetical protein
VNAQDFVQPNASVQQIRYALTVSKIERGAICDTNKAIKHAILALGSGGGICGQCEAFKPLGNISGLNGTCYKLSKGRFIQPEEAKCDFFEKRKGV